MQYLTLEEILKLHFEVIEKYGGSHGVRDEKRLESLVIAPSQEVFGIEQYPSLPEKASVYMRNIIGGHPFADGNKRTGTTVAVVFLMANDSKLTATPKELEDFAVQVAVEHLEVAEIADWLKCHSEKQ